MSAMNGIKRQWICGRDVSALPQVRPAPRSSSVTLHGASRSRAAAAASSSSSPSSSTPSTSSPSAPSTSPVFDHTTSVSPRQEAQLTLEQYKEIYDRLIKIFTERPRDDWKKLIVFSKQWPQHQNGVFERIKELSDKEEDIDKKMQLRKMFRTLQGVNEEVGRYNSMLKKFADAAEDEWEAIVATYRGDLQRGFFEHMQCLIAAAAKDQGPEQKEQLVAMNTKLVALCTNHDSIAADPAKLEAAAEVYRDLLSSISSMEDVDKKMAELGAQGKIDPAFLQISAKAYGAARDTNMTLEESKWVAYKLYRNARDQFDRKQSAEKRIIEYLVSIRDPRERSRMLDEAVTPGPTRMTDTHDYMFSTPQRLYSVLHGTLTAYADMTAAAGPKLGTSAESILPRKIIAMRELRDEVRRRYL